MAALPPFADLALVDIKSSDKLFIIQERLNFIYQSYMHYLYEYYFGMST